MHDHVRLSNNNNNSEHLTHNDIEHSLTTCNV